jgi:hypothetical protein
MTPSGEDAEPPRSPVFPADETLSQKIPIDLQSTELWVTSTLPNPTSPLCQSCSRLLRCWRHGGDGGRQIERGLRGQLESLVEPATMHARVDGLWLLLDDRGRFASTSRPTSMVPTPPLHSLKFNYDAMTPLVNISLSIYPTPPPVIVDENGKSRWVERSKRRKCPPRLACQTPLGAAIPTAAGAQWVASD